MHSPLHSSYPDWMRAEETEDRQEEGGHGLNRAGQSQATTPGKGIPSTSYFCLFSEVTEE